jgi:fructose-bisphosphate aldolase class 1
MSSLDLAEIVQALFAGDRGLLAMDESVETCNKRFAEVGIAPTPENRHAYRDWIIRTPRLNEAIGGAILFDETIRQTSADGKSFCQLAATAGIIPGIKVFRIREPSCSLHSKYGRPTQPMFQKRNRRSSTGQTKTDWPVAGNTTHP